MSQWTAVDPAKPPALHIVALYNDGSGAVCLTKFDDCPYMQAEDGWKMSDEEVRNAFSLWTAAPEGWVPHFMEVYD